MQDFARHMREFGRKDAKKMRDQARLSAMKRKEEYLGARVPKDLREKVIAKADGLGIPVSILIRNILEEAFRDADSGGARQARSSQSPEARTGKFPGVIGWEEIRLNKDMPCSACSRMLRMGGIATLGLGAPGEDHVILCDKCREDV